MSVRHSVEVAKVGSGSIAFTVGYVRGYVLWLLLPTTSISFKKPSFTVVHFNQRCFNLQPLEKTEFLGSMPDDEIIGCFLIHSRSEPILHWVGPCSCDIMCKTSSLAFGCAAPVLFCLHQVSLASHEALPDNHRVWIGRTTGRRRSIHERWCEIGETFTLTCASTSSPPCLMSTRKHI